MSIGKLLYTRASQRGPGVHSAISGGPHKNAMSAHMSASYKTYECTFRKLLDEINKRWLVWTVTHPSRTHNTE